MSSSQFFTLVAIAYLAPHISAKVAMPIAFVAIIFSILYLWVI